MKNLFTKKQYDNLNEYLQSAKHAAIITHTNPDGDAIGSSVALSYILEKLNINSTVVVSNDFPDFLHWIDGSDKIAVYSKNKHVARNAIKTADVIFCLDFNSLDRIEILEKIVRETTVPRILIDHHIAPSNDFDLKFSYYPISSTSELVYRIGIRLLGTKILPKNIAEALFCGMLTDTGAFTHSSSYPDFFKIIANLLDSGVDKNKITRLIYDNFSECRMKLLGFALSKMVVLHDYRAAYIILSKEDLKNFNFRIGDTEGFVNYPLSIKGIILSLLLVEKDDHIKMSIRSQGNFDVNELARKHFHGGGHLNAAGGKMPCKYEDCAEELEKIIKNYEEKLCNS
ncbi:MAG: bifunctional oligoribonuclease/PAP phosphatase NrnA [Prevotellaceae bacterium]|jgi:phosphoesterase RecJ-like protein|nr:bifunctional oligoribonuclease/PAP phosphatase NrnA [Prevotellaceae bacterium]